MAKGRAEHLLDTEAVGGLSVEPALHGRVPLLAHLAERDVERELLAAELAEQLVELAEDHVLLLAQMAVAGREHLLTRLMRSGFCDELPVRPVATVRHRPLERCAPCRKI